MTLFRRIREQNNLSLTEMAERLEISISYCSMLDSGQRAISKDIALKLKTHFNVPLEQSLCAQEVHKNETKAATGTDG